MGRNADGRDIDHYRAACLAACPGGKGRVLEFGCGTGRITLALVEAGLSVVGIDRSLPMLRVLQRKVAERPATAARPLLAVMDMGTPALSASFAAILCPFSAFTYLVEDSERAAALGFVRGALAPRGRFLMDVFVPDPRVEAAADGSEMFDYRRPFGAGWLERHKRIARNVRPAVNRIRRRYRFLSADGTCERELVTESLQRVYRFAELVEIIRDSGLRIVSASADFTGAPVDARSRTVVIEAERAAD